MIKKSKEERSLVLTNIVAPPKPKVMSQVGFQKVSRKKTNSHRNQPKNEIVILSTKNMKNRY